MADAGQYKKVRDIVLSDPARSVIVVSAAGKRFVGDHKLTDLLYLCHAHIRYGVDCSPVFDMIAERYREICRELELKTDIEAELSALREELSGGISQDRLVSRGEYFSARLLADYLGFEFLDAADWLHFSFDGSIKVLSRGGSDVSGALAAAALDADVYENWTDVSGILMADPRIVENPDTISRITYSELRELSYMGAQVLHEGAVFPVREKNIPLNIRNTNDPLHPGTVIMEKFPDDEQSERFITGIAGRRHFTIITVSKAGLSSEIGSLRKILELFERHGVCVEYTPSGIDTVSLVVSAESVSSCLYALVGEVQKALSPDGIQITDGISVVAAVGRKMAYKPGSSGRLFAALGKSGINIRMISQGPEELNIIVGVNDDDFEKTVRVLYHSFVK